MEKPTKRQINRRIKMRQSIGRVLIIFSMAAVAVSAHAQLAYLADAVERKDEALISRLLDERTDVNATQVDGMTALHWAAYHDLAELTDQLLRSGANVHAENRYGVPSLSLASTNGNPSIVKLLLDFGADPNQFLEGGETALMIAARTGNLNAVKALLAAGADPNAKEQREQTALMWAAAEGHASVVNALLDAEADVHATLRSGFTPLFFSVREGHIDVALALLEAGGEVNEILRRVRDRTGQSGNNATTQPISQGLSPLLMAVRNGHFELAIELVKAGADPNDEQSGFTPLHTMSWVRKPDASDRGDPAPIGSGNLSSLDFVRELVQLGADVNLTLREGAPRQPNSSTRLDSGGSTPLLLAADRADTALVRLFLELGASPFMSNLRGTTPLMAAAGLGTTAPEEEAGTELEALEVTRLMLELGGDVNTVNEENDTAVHGAAYAMFPAVIELLADHGADPHIWNRTNHRGWTPLFIAEGYRFGLPRPSGSTIAVVERLMFEADISTKGLRPEVIDIYEVPENQQ
jgi:ankyrin repeat protein